MATTRRESSLEKEKRGTSPSSSSITHDQRRPSLSSGSTEKQVPNYLKPTITSRSDAIQNVNKTGAVLLRRRSFDRPASAARLQKELTSPGRDKPTTFRSASFSSKSTTAPKATAATLERVAKKPNAGKPQTFSSSRSMKKTPNPTPANKGSTSSVSKKPPSSNDKKVAQNLEIRHENEENLDHQVEEVVKNEQGEIDDVEIPKAEESEHPDVVDTTEVKSVEEGKSTPDNISTVSQEHNVLQTEEMEDNFHEEKSDHIQHNEDNENQNKEEIDVGHDHQENIPHREEAKIETDEDEAEDNATEVVATTKEIGEAKQLESRQENDEGSEQGLESSKEEIVEREVEESKAKAANVVAKSQAQTGYGKKESPTPYNDVIEETASKLLEERKNKVRALVGAFETVIDKETSNAK
ncbi:hypothetical protein REPUB_Repub18cG0172500 [Reevesia pubescens]